MTDGIKDRAQQESMYKTVEAKPMKPSSISDIKQMLALCTYEPKRAKSYNARFMTEIDKSGSIDSVYEKSSGSEQSSGRA